MPESQSLAVLEWGLNLAIALRCQTYLMLHSAVVARGEYALIMPAAPGDGKSTLCAALVLRGWRLLSDEFGLLLPGQTRVVPIPRPIPLKGQSIDIIQSESQSAEFGPVIEGTKKGTVRHLLPPPQSIVSQDVTAEARWIVFPKWSADAETRVTELRGIEAFMRIAGNSFNYEVLGEPAFQSVTALVRTCRCYELEYSNLDSAISVLGQLG